jgi:hypothetical protein
MDETPSHSGPGEVRWVLSGCAALDLKMSKIPSVTHGTD